VTRVSTADDLAIIQVSVRLPVLLFMKAKPKVGDVVMAFGSPLGLEGTVSSGIVSALRHQDGLDYIQFTAAISPGNSGGPVVNSNGDVLGVAEMKMVGSNAENLAFAIPTATVCADFPVC
jgi:putative serine protease PepD